MNRKKDYKQCIKLVISGVFLFVHSLANAQDGNSKSISTISSLSTNATPDQKYTPQTGIRGAYMGSLLYPGFKVGIERPYKYTQIDKKYSKRTKTIYKERYLSYSLGMYHQVNYHTNWMLNAEWIKRRQKSKGFYYETSLGAGINRAFVASPTYEVLPSGEVDRAYFSGNTYANISVGGALGYNFNVSKQKPYSIYVKHHWHIMFPHNKLILPRPTLEIGFNYNVSGIWDSNPKHKLKSKESRKFKKINLK